MKKLFIDIGKLSQIKKKLKKKTINYNVIIFDLDNTIYPLYFFDYYVFKDMSISLEKKFKVDRKKIFQFLINHKHILKKNIKLFDDMIDFFKFHKLIKKNKLISYYQNFRLKNSLKFPSIKSLLEELSKKKKLILITEGHYKRQKKKIDFLKINFFFKHIFILDGKYNRKFKPSTKGLKKISKFVKSSKTLYVGDSNKDSLLAKRLKVDFHLFDQSKLLYEK